MQKIEVESVYHLSCSKSGVVFGAGITKGSEGLTVDGENIKAGKFPALFYGYTKNLKKDQRAKARNAQILNRVNIALKKSKVKRSCVNQGNSPNG